MTFCKHVLNVPLRQGKRNATKLTEGNCWAITKVPGRSCGSRSVWTVLECRFQLDLFVYAQVDSDLRRTLQNAAFALSREGLYN